MSDHYKPRTATAIIIANMVGTGVFTSLGFQLLDIQDGFALLMLWVLGGVAALCGAASYGELGAALPRSGGEYNFLGRIYHPAAGFISGWISAVIGFAAPIAASAIVFGTYATAALPGDYGPWVTKGLAASVVIIATLIHGRNRGSSGAFQSSFTLIKVIMIVAFCLAGLLLVADAQPISFAPSASGFDAMTSGSYAVALIYVSYAYTGWNAATYISGEMKNPQRDLPRVLLVGTAIVMALYVALNYVFLRVAPIDAMTGREEIGYIAATYIFGDTAARVTGMALALLLVSTVSAMVLAGPRALQGVGEDFPALGFLGRVNGAGVPRNAIYFQSAVTLIFILTSSFEFIVIFAGAMLALNSLLAVVGVFVLRYREPDLPRPYRTWGYPVTPLIYIALTVFTLVFVVMEKPLQAGFAAGLIALGGVFYWLSKRLGR
ncbi:APC family permease [Fretibacter rubidus]|uniref:APC family permease n=1 Tax=Fretibacter rubidus TaxID=570162 RepID=UPI00352A0BCA